MFNKKQKRIKFLERQNEELEDELVRTSFKYFDLKAKYESDDMTSEEASIVSEIKIGRLIGFFE
ncbi:hypothetical protein H7198_06015 [Fructobacillus sp. CRL 2054]|uniref:hypothetical protein n=1 Tax=Fructobacillus sp. CRL 2054 TaxID=2763007 RepID=UPI002378199D|nr:hypothetical protein [Fructobacillus sp. CRL 2054]MDD9139156.1 hypothetical protein [Fructobacillus sp. CRL 2054]